MRIGIIGAGGLGGLLARRLAKLGHRVSIAISRGPERLTALAAEIGATPVSVVDAAGAGEIIIIAIPASPNAVPNGRLVSGGISPRRHQAAQCVSEVLMLDSVRSSAGRVAVALTHRNFRLLWMGALVSSIGTWMQKVAQSWLIVTMTGSSSAFFLGLDSFLSELPLLLFTMVGGVFADRRDRRHMILTSQITQMLVALVLAVLIYAGRIHMAHVLALSFIAGCARAFGGPAYQSLIPTLVGREHLSNAIALNSIQFDLARVVGPVVAGVALSAFGMVACFGVNAISFLFVIAAILALRDVHVPPMATESMIDQFKGGLRFVRGSPDLITVMALGFIGAFLGQPLLTLLPVITRDVFHQDVGFYTRLMTFSGAGAVVGALIVAWLGTAVHGTHVADLPRAVRHDDGGFRDVADVLPVCLDPVHRWLAPRDVFLAHDFAGAASHAAGAPWTRGLHLFGGVPGRLTARGSRERMARHKGRLRAGGVDTRRTALTLVALYFLVRGHGLKDI